MVRVGVAVLVPVGVRVDVGLFVGVDVGVSVTHRPETEHAAPDTTLHPSQLPPTGPPHAKPPHWQQSFGPGVGACACSGVVRNARSMRTISGAQPVLRPHVQLYRCIIALRLQRRYRRPYVLTRVNRATSL
jgi:hypothetical protein